MTGQEWDIQWYRIYTDALADFDDRTAREIANEETDLRENGPSPDFCGEPCQMAWHAKQARPLPPPKVEGRAALLHDRPGRGYSADLVIVDEVVEGVEVQDIQLTSWQRGWLTEWFRRHR